jgi:hypothetical protein
VGQRGSFIDGTCLSRWDGNFGIGICPAVELPNAVLAPPATPAPIEAPRIDSPAPINPDVPPVTNAFNAAVAPPVAAVAPILVAIAPIFSIGILFPNPSGSFIFVGGFIVDTCGLISFCIFFFVCFFTLYRSIHIIYYFRRDRV